MSIRTVFAYVTLTAAALVVFMAIVSCAPKSFDYEGYTVTVERANG